jgi:hypothetical protein
MTRNIDRWVRAMKADVEALQVPSRVEDAFGRYRDRPVTFCRDVLGADSATRRSDGSSYQFDVLNDVVRHPRVAVMSGHGVGKTAIDAWAALWWLLTRPMSRVLVLAPEYSRQIRGP